MRDESYIKELLRLGCPLIAVIQWDNDIQKMIINNKIVPATHKFKDDDPLHAVVIAGYD